MRRALVAGLLIALALPSIGWAQGLTVFAAASLSDVLRDIAARWTETGHQPPRLSFGASSALARQIEQGAPANLFAAADLRWMDYLADRGLIAADTRTVLLGNELVLVVPADQPRQIAIGPGLDLLGLLGPDGRLATGDPAHVPLGIYATQALRTLGVWEGVRSRLAATDDARAALLFVARGEARAGIVYATDAAAAKGVVVAGRFPAESHDPVVYPFAVTRSGDNKEARALMAFLRGPEARAAFVRFGFTVK